MLSIYIPNNNLPEREYIIKILFSDYLGLRYKLVPSNSKQHYSIVFNNVELIVKDSFFNLFPASLTYLNKDTLPKDIFYATNDFTFEKDIPVIYGSNEFSVSKNKIICGIDIFASSFFMLTRWEEYVNTIRDEHQRFPGIESVAFKNSFLHRPVVNEFVELLWRFLQKLGFGAERKKRSFSLVLTHDIDQLDYPNTYHILLGDMLKRRSLSLAKKNIVSYLRSRSNPYNTFDFIMNISERLGIKSHFYFMSSDLASPPDNDFYIERKRFKQTIKVIKERGHIIGFHPGYYTYNDSERWTYEKQLLEEGGSS